MDLELDADQAALAESVRSVLEREWPPTALRRLVEDGTGAAELWQRLVGLDWPALCVPAADGGMGYGAVEAALVLDGCGRAVVGGPLLPTVALFAPLVRALGSDGQRAEWLGGAAAGTTTGVAALTELAASGTVDPDASALRLRATRDGEGWRLDGSARSVIEGATVDAVLVPAVVDGRGLGVFVVRPGDAGVASTPVHAVDATRELVTLHLDGATVGPGAVLGEPGSVAVSAALRRAVDESVTLLAAELVGTCATILDTVLDHAKGREQFGVPIGSFQALKHRLADAYLALEAARASVLVAAVALDEDDPRRSSAASTAKAMAGECADVLTREGIQLLGGLGFTWEHDMHLYVKRAMASRALLGGVEVHRQRVAELIGLVPA